MDSAIARRARALPFKVKLGDPLFFTGLFVQSAGAKRNLPIVRFGNISRMPLEPISCELKARGTVELVVYLAECHSWGGHSGSPVYWYKEIMFSEEMEVRHDQRALVSLDRGHIIALLGLVSGHFDIPAKGQSKSEQARSKSGEEEIYTKINAGIAFITPADNIHEMLWREDLQVDRIKRLEQIKARERKESPITFDSAVQNDKTETTQRTRQGVEIPIPKRSQFERALQKATRRKNPSS
jgi:hypothetical protein